MRTLWVSFLFLVSLLSSVIVSEAQYIDLGYQIYSRNGSDADLTNPIPYFNFTLYREHTTGLVATGKTAMSSRSHLTPTGTNCPAFINLLFTNLGGSDHASYVSYPSDAVPLGRFPRKAFNYVAPGISGTGPTTLFSLCSKPVLYGGRFVLDDNVYMYGRLRNDYIPAANKASYLVSNQHIRLRKRHRDTLGNIVYEQFIETYTNSEGYFVFRNDDTGLGGYIPAEVMTADQLIEVGFDDGTGCYCNDSYVDIGTSKERLITQDFPDVNNLKDSAGGAYQYMHSARAVNFPSKSAYVQFQRRPEHSTGNCRNYGWAKYPATSWKCNSN